MKRIRIREVGPRDGLQNESTVLSPTARAELCRRLAQSGLSEIEAVSFVREDLVPPMAGAEEVLELASDVDQTAWSGLVLNRRGYERARAVGVTEIHYAIPVSESMAERNQSTTVSAAVELGIDLIRLAHLDGVKISIGLAMAFGCPIEGQIPGDHVVQIAHDILAAGPDELCLADSVGLGVPSQVREMVQAVVDGGVEIGCHFHNTRNMGYVNALAAAESGATILDAAVGGLGGCPFAPGATGNIATEDLAFLLEGMGYDTGVDFKRLRDTSAWLAAQVGHELPSLLARAGDPIGIIGSNSGLRRPA